MEELALCFYEEGFLGLHLFRDSFTTIAEEPWAAGSRSSLHHQT